jgi:transcriptional regulator MftR-like protein
LQKTFAAMATSDWGPENSRQQLLYTLPEAAGALYNEYIHTMELIADALAVRLNRSADDIELQTTAGAMTGVFMMALHGRPMDPNVLFPALDFLDAGLPLEANPV